MDISVSKQSGRVDVTVLALNGELDGQTYQELIKQARDLHAGGVRDILLDLAGLTYISSAGLVAIHTTALLLRGEPIPDSDDGWASMKSVKKSSAGGLDLHLKLLNPSPEVRSVLEMVGFDRAFEIHTDLEAAVRSF